MLWTCPPHTSGTVPGESFHLVQGPQTAMPVKHVQRCLPRRCAAARQPDEARRLPILICGICILLLCLRIWLWRRWQLEGEGDRWLHDVAAAAAPLLYLLVGDVSKAAAVEAPQHEVDCVAEHTACKVGYGDQRRAGHLCRAVVHQRVVLLRTAVKDGRSSKRRMLEQAASVMERCSTLQFD